MITTYILDARTATPHFPGIGRYVTNISTALLPLLAPDERLSVLCSASANPGLRMSDDSRLDLVERNASPFSLQQQWQIPQTLRALQANRADSDQGARPLLYHSPYYLMPYLVPTPTVLTFYDLIPLFFPQYVSRRARLLFRFTMRLALRASQHIFSISESARQDLTQRFAVDPDRITTTPLAPAPRFRPQPRAEIEHIRQRYGLPPTFLLYFGSNKPHKNLPNLIKAYAERSGTASCPLVIAGAWDEHYLEPKELVARKNLTDTVNFLGPIPDADLPGLYAAATAFIFPSRYEGFGLPVLEAMSCGTPVACSNTSSLPEVTGNAALLFAPDNINAIADSLEQLMDKQTRLLLRERGLQQAARFTWQRTAQQTLSVYRSLVK